MWPADHFFKTYPILLLTAPMSTTDTATSVDNKVCHSLPCSIDYQGMAPVHAFFHPMPINRIDGNSEKQQQEARFRGRKLLAASPPVPVQGMVLELEPGSDESSTATTSSSFATPKSTLMHRNRQTMAFHSIQEWHHEESLVEIATSRVNTAMGWFPIAKAMHEELAVLQD
ncbi:hypothetical protein MHU86_193 [Fragilaria crotonensis]|nr:hypothetical protein MHU86_193 [Fragilaria crotonensis]